MKVTYLGVEHVIVLHDMAIHKIGGTLGIRDQGLLESAVYQAQQSFGGQELYPTLFDKAAAYCFFIAENQAFLDGNKRTAIAATYVFLDINGYLLTAPEGSLYDVMIKLAGKQLTHAALADWFKKNTKPRVADSTT